MTVNTDQNRIQYEADGATSIFPYPFLVTAEEQIQIYFDDVGPIVGGYTVTGIGDEAGGNIIFDDDPDDETLVTILREVPVLQNTDLEPYDDFPAEVIEATFDEIVLMIQQVQNAFNGTLRFPPFAPADADAELPGYEPNAILGWDPLNYRLINFGPQPPGSAPAVLSVNNIFPNPAGDVAIVTVNHATNADLATNATNADQATLALTANNALALGGFPESDFMRGPNNLSEITDPQVARDNLGVRQGAMKLLVDYDFSSDHWADETFFTGIGAGFNRFYWEVLDAHRVDAEPGNVLAFQTFTAGAWRNQGGDYEYDTAGVISASQSACRLHAGTYTADSYINSAGIFNSLVRFYATSFGGAYGYALTGGDATTLVRNADAASIQQNGGTPPTGLRFGLFDDGNGNDNDPYTILTGNLRIYGYYE